MIEDYREFDPVEDLPALERLAAELNGEGRLVDARLVRRAWRAQGGSDIEDPGPDPADG